MKSAAPALIALLVAVIALAVALFRAPDPPLHFQAPLSAVSSEERALDQRVANLETEVSRLGEEIAILRSRPPGTREAVGSAEVDADALTARLAELERELTQLRNAPKTTSTKIDEFVRRQAGASAVGDGKGAKDWVRMARSGTATEEELLLALRALRGIRPPDGTDARLEVLPEMIRLAETSQDERARADVFRQLSGVTNRSLLQPLLRALQNDPSAIVREEAAETLGHFLPDPNVRDALQFAAENDASPDVRAQCYESLAPRRR